MPGLIQFKIPASPESELTIGDAIDCYKATTHPGNRPIDGDDGALQYGFIYVTDRVKNFLIGELMVPKYGPPEDGADPGDFTVIHIRSHRIKVAQLPGSWPYRSWKPYASGEGVQVTWAELQPYILEKA